MKNHYYTNRATVKTYHDITVNAAGEFSLVQTIDSDEGLYYTAYIKVGDSYPMVCQSRQLLTDEITALIKATIHLFLGTDYAD